VAWHQDVTIAVTEHREEAGWGPWSKKAGTWHVRPPAEVLEGMVAIRLHLDDCRAGNGPLRVIPGSHRAGRLSDIEVATRSQSGTSRDCLVPAGGVLLMRPLLLHASAAATAPGHRRVLHIEYAASPLPDGLVWAGQLVGAA
jgi:ectoine hydroxylase-related dioxygenase (phytanoyl-CoA dioxygenase family)